ncbi:MAG: gliding motility-associated C-terminal domain-containing protein [Cyclobacteriaceae bacterium]|jgi:gliding motility-associated-like protein|nr:gliding motility-associated C-terminal domain-containing protein [Cyclobacteriaceae bacterium]
MAGVKTWVVIWAMSLPAVALAQPYTSVGGNFTVNEKRGCAPLTITLNTGALCVGACNVRYENETPSPTFTHTFNTPGTYEVRVFFPNFQDFITVTVEPNITPAVELYSCGGRRVRVNVTDQTYDSYSINLGDGNTVAIPSGTHPSIEHTYAAAGNYTIRVRGRNVDGAFNCTERVLPFSAVNTLPPGTIQGLTTASASQIDLALNPDPAIQYRLEIATNGTAGFQTVRTIYQATATTLSNLNTDQNFYCFRIGTFDPCANAVVAYSPVICSHRFTLTLTNGSNNLAWTIPNTGIAANQTRIERVEPDNNNNSLTRVVPGIPTSFTDVDITCNINYCYRVITRYTNGSTSTSAPRCGVSFVTRALPPIINTSAVVDAAGATLLWQPPSALADRYTVSRRSGNAPFQPLAETTSPNFLDDGYQTEIPFCYRIGYGDACANTAAPGGVVCPLRLTARPQAGTEVALAWSGYKGWNNGVRNYRIERYDGQGNLINILPPLAANDTVFVDDDDENQLITYRVEATAVQAGLPVSYSNSVTIRKEPRLITPTAFTPNNDNLNDTFAVFGKYIERMQLHVFDRWGNTVFFTDNNEPWDGTLRGQPLPESAYVWRATVVDKTGQTVTKTGTVALMRK